MKSPARISNTIGRQVVLITALAALIAAAAPALAADRLMPGQYEFTITRAGQTQTVAQCVTPEEAKGVNGDAKAGREYAEKAGKGGCTIKAYDVTGDTVSYTMACGQSETTTRTTYRGDTFEGDVTRTMRGKTFATHTKAKRIGACK